MMTGLLHPTEGQILFHGRNIRDDSTGFKQRLGYVPEEPNLYGYLTALEQHPAYAALFFAAAGVLLALSWRHRREPGSARFDAYKSTIQTLGLSY
jgi:ABC-type transport system involved in cytochrome c biogenesis ATPase subunit